MCLFIGTAQAGDYIPSTQNELHFATILEEYRNFNTRLENVAAPLLIENTTLCPHTTRGLGMNVHTLTDYQANLQPFAEVLMGASDRLSIRTVRAGSPADIAGLRGGDVIRDLDGAYMPGGFTVQKFYKLASKNAFQKDSIDITVRRNNETLTLTATPEILCAYPVNVVFNEKANGHTDGEQIYITSELMRTVPDDVNLALIVAHEMAHAIEGHQRKDKALELKADRMALIMMSRAGYDINKAIEYWRRANHPHANFQEASKTHPTISERYDNFMREQRRIEKLKASGKELQFN